MLSSCHAWQERKRKLSQLVIVYYVIALSLFGQCNVTQVFAYLSRGLRWLQPDPSIRLPSGGALTARRQSLGIPVLRQRFRVCCHPLATPKTKGAFAFGLRLMAVDNTLDEMPDTPATALHFGRLTTGKSQRPLPQVRCLQLVEVGTHAIIDAVLARCKASEQALARVIVRSIQSAMLGMPDRTFGSVTWLLSVRQRGAHGLFTQRSSTLADGSSLVTLRPKGQPPLVLRVIEQRLLPLVAQDLALLPVSRTARPSDPCALHRLVTSVLVI